MQVRDATRFAAQFRKNWHYGKMGSPAVGSTAASTVPHYWSSCFQSQYNPAPLHELMRRPCTARSRKRGRAKLEKALESALQQTQSVYQ